MKTKNANLKMPGAKVEIFHFAFCLLPFALLVISGCTAFQVGGEIVNGRRELMYGDPKVALAHFQRASELDPDYLFNLSIFPQGVWTYVGRAYYATGKLPDARKALERASFRYEQDNLAKLYLGLVLARDGEQQRGFKEMEAGLKGLEDWLYHIEQYNPEGRFWDPARELRREIQRELAMIGGKEIDGKELIASGEWLGREFEEEFDRVQRDKKHDIMSNDGDGKGN